MSPHFLGIEAFYGREPGMPISDPLLFLGLILILIHFGLPIAYYLYARRKWLPRPWGISSRKDWLPRLTVVIPTYNEEKNIVEKLENIRDQDYPAEKIRIVIVDSASTDRTVELAEKWASRSRGIEVVILREEERRGKARALNKALSLVDTEVFFITDADCTWAKTALRKAVELLSDPGVGAVSCVKKPSSSGVAGIEEAYRGFYNTLRVSESKAFSTPIFHGELAGFRTGIVKALGGFPTDIGADDSHMATLIALKGYRAIVHDSILCFEAIPPKDYHRWRIRRAQHLVQHFWRILLIRGKRVPRVFKAVLYVEAFLHLFNPWLLLVGAGLLVLSSPSAGALPLLLLSAGLLLLLYRPYRTWITAQVYLVAGAIRNLWTREIVWEKQEK